MIGSPNHMERKRYYPVTPRSGDRDGCIHIGLGSGMQWSADRWPEVQGKTTGIHQWTGLMVGIYAMQAVAKEKQNVHIHLRMVNTLSLSYVTEWTAHGLPH